jgi:hypothetical protein
MREVDMMLSEERQRVLVHSNQFQRALAPPMAYAAANLVSVKLKLLRKPPEMCSTVSNPMPPPDCALATIDRAPATT